MGRFIIEASRQKRTKEPLGEALDSNEALDVTSDVILAKRYKPRHALHLEVLHFRDTRFESPLSFVTSLSITIVRIEVCLCSDHSLSYSSVNSLAECDSHFVFRYGVEVTVSVKEFDSVWFLSAPPLPVS